MISPWLCHTQHFKKHFQNSKCCPKHSVFIDNASVFFMQQLSSPKSLLTRGIPKDSILLMVHVTTEAPRFSHAAMCHL